MIEDRSSRVGLQIKAMAEYLDRSGKMMEARKNRFSRHFLDDVSKLVGLLTREVVDNCSSNPTMKELNASLAFFVRDCLSLVDRSFVFKQILHYCNVVRSKFGGTCMYVVCVGVK